MNAIAPTSIHPGPRAACHILLVDDDLAVLTTVGGLLEQEGYDVATAINGSEALELLLRHRPQLVILDMRMPIMNGWDFARALKARGIEVPTLVMSANGNAARWSAEIGAGGALAKPFEADELIRQTERLCLPA
jgi:CheY-like chemotaxis protein